MTTPFVLPHMDDRLMAQLTEPRQAPSMSRPCNDSPSRRPSSHVCLARAFTLKPNFHGMAVTYRLTSGRRAEFTFKAADLVNWHDVCRRYLAKACPKTSRCPTTPSVVDSSGEGNYFSRATRGRARSPPHFMVLVGLSLFPFGSTLFFFVAASACAIPSVPFCSDRFLGPLGGAFITNDARSSGEPAHKPQHVEGHSPGR